MSRTHRIGRSLGVATIGLILVSGTSFAHDATSDTPSSPSSWTANGDVQPPGIEVDDRQGDDLDAVDELQSDHNVSGSPDDRDDPAGAQDPAEVKTGDSDKVEQGEHDTVKPVKPAKEVKAPKTHKADPTKSSDAGDKNDHNDDNQADGNDQGGDHQDGDHQDGNQNDGHHSDGGHDDSGSGGDD